MSRRSPDDIDRHVGTRVRLQRLLMGMSQTELGEALGVTFQQVQKYENGTNRIGAGRLHRIAQVLGKPVTFFYDQAATENGATANGSGDTLASFTAMAGAVELMKAFASIPDGAKRRNLVELARALASESQPTKLPARAPRRSPAASAAAKAAPRAASPARKERARP